MPRLLPTAIAVLVLLGLAGSAHAATVPPSGSPLSLLTVEVPDPELELEEDEGGGGEECEEEDEEGECVAAASEEEDQAATECLLKSASATVSVLTERDKVRLTLRYTTFSAAVVSVEYGLRGRKGALRMGKDSRRFSQRGVFRDTERISDAEMRRVKAASEFDVRIHAVNTPRYCHRLLDRRLITRRTSGRGPLWTE
jgi:hypothetical protein